MRKKNKKNNLFLFIPLGILMIASFFCMFQARFIKSLYLGHLQKQILWFFIGFFLLFVFQKVKIKFFFRYSFWFYILGVLLLFLVLFFGKSTNGARAWFDLKFFHLQPSEFMKIALLLYLAKITDDFKTGKIKEFWYVLKSIFITLFPSLLVFLEPDTGAIILYLLLLFSVLLLSGIKKWWFILTFFLVGLLGGCFLYLYLYKQDTLIELIGTSFFYRMDRLIHFKDGSGLQLNNALTTIGNTKIFGNGIQKELLYVPEFPTDFVFTLSISIFGFLGVILLLFCYFFLNIYLINLLQTTKDFSYKLFVHGFFYIFLYQQIQNIFMNIGLLPIMGIPLPFLSYGGSNMIVYFICLGFILNMNKKRLNATV